MAAYDTIGSGSGMTQGQRAEQQMSAEDRERLRAAGERYNNATTQADRDAAHAEAEAIRANYGYSGGANGAGYTSTSSGSGAGNTGAGYTPPRANAGVGNATTGRVPASKSPSLGTGAGGGGNQDGGQYGDLNGARETTVVRNGKQIKAYIVNGRTVDANGQPFAFENGDVVNTNGGAYRWNNGGAAPISQQEYLAAMGLGTPDVVADQLNNPAAYSGFSYYQGGPTTYIEDYYQNQFAPLEQQLSRIDDWYASQEGRLSNMIDAATRRGVLDLEAQLENGLTDYDQQRAQAAITQARAANNAALRNAAAGDMGGIGQKQYSAEQNSYDQQMLSIQLEQINFQNSINQQIAQLEAEGRYQEAQMLSEWGQQKVNALQDQYNYYWDMRYKNAYDIDYLHRTTEMDAYEKETADNERAYNRAMQRLQLGIFNAEDAEALGIPADEAEDLANYYQQMAAIDLEAAQADLANRLAKTNGSGSGGGSGRYYGGGGGGGGGDDDTSSDDPFALFNKLYEAGYEPGSYELYNALLKAGYGNAQWRIEDQEAFYDQFYENKKAEEAEAALPKKRDDVHQTTISNIHDADEIQVPGLGTISYDQLRNYMRQGLVTETVNRGVYTYRYNPKGSYSGGGINVIEAR